MSSSVHPTTNPTAASGRSAARWPRQLTAVAALFMLISMAGCSSAELDAKEKHERQQVAAGEAKLAELAARNRGLEEARHAIADALAKERASAAAAAEALKSAADADKAAAQKALEAASAKAAATEKELTAALQLIRDTEAERAKVEADKKVHEAVAAQIAEIKRSSGDPLRQAGEVATGVSPYLPGGVGAVVGAIGLVLRSISQARLAAANQKLAAREESIATANQKLAAREELIGNISVAKAAGELSIQPARAAAMKDMASDAALAELHGIEADWKAEIESAKARAAIRPTNGASTSVPPAVA